MNITKDKYIAPLLISTFLIPLGIGIHHFCKEHTAIQATLCTNNIHTTLHTFYHNPILPETTLFLEEITKYLCKESRLTTRDNNESQILSFDIRNKAPPPLKTNIKNIE